MKKRVRKSKMPLEIINLGIKIQIIIKNKGMKQRDVAYDAGIDVENLRKYIKGKQEMKVSTMLKIAVALNVNVAELFDN